jgi:DNA-binding NtrC family response regulator
VLDKGFYTVLGAARVSKVDVRVIGATNADPKDALKHDFAARFVMAVHVPPVREHRDDIGLTLRQFLKEADANVKGDLPSTRRISPTFMDFLVRHPLPTNARQIESIMYMALAANTPGQLKLPASLREDVPPSKQPASVTRPSAPPMSQPREEKPEGASRGGRPKEAPLFSEAQVRGALEATGWDVSAATVRLGMSRGKMLRVMKHWGVTRPER